MFRQFALFELPPGTPPRPELSIPGRAELLFRLHPVELAALLEQAWEFRKHDTSRAIGHPDRRSDIPGLPEYLLRAFPNFRSNRNNFGGADVGLPETDPRSGCLRGCLRWEHLIYAYMIENTGAYEIFRRVLYLYRHGEELGVPLEGSEHWLRNTEELFYREPAPFFIYSLTSAVRPNLDATRRAAYYRMFGMDLNHGTEEGKPYPYVPYVKAAAANTEFVNTLEEFLREVWIGIINVNNTSGENPTDEAKIADLAERLFDMFTTRRLSGNLAQEEFWLVSLMSWFHLTLDFNSPIVVSLRAEGSSPEERLFKISQRVNLPAHKLSKNFFDMADAISRLFISIETGIFNTAAAAPQLFTPGQTEQDIRTVITHWSLTTGRDLRARKVRPT